MPKMPAVVFLFDVDNTLLDNDRVQADLSHHLGINYGTDARDRYWQIFEDQRVQLGYADYLGALQRYRLEAMHDPRVLRIAPWLSDYPFAERLYEDAIAAVRWAQRLGTTVVLSDGDAAFQPLKVERSGLWRVFHDNVLIFIHKEESLDDVERLFPARHYVMIDDKLNILDALKRSWGDRVTTVFPKQGHYAWDPAILAQYPHGDIQLERICDLMRLDPAAIGHP